jgi:hypothetical protein
MGFVLVILIMAIVIPAYAVRACIRRGKRERSSEIIGHLNELENHIVSCAYTTSRSNSTRAALPSIESYWKILCERQIAISQIPLSSFKVRELGSRIATLVLVPTLLLVVGAVIN